MSEKMPTLAETSKAQIESVEQAIGDLLLDFTNRTGFVVESAFVNYSDPFGSKPRYYVDIKVSL